MRFIKRAVCSVLLAAGTATAGNLPEIEGFGMATWGISKEKILAAEGTPTETDRETGEITYQGKTVMGMKAIVRYRFETGCTDFDPSQCRFADGQYIFGDAPKEFFLKIEDALAGKYGASASVKTENKEYPSVASSGRCEVETLTTERVRGRALLKFARDCSLHDFTSKFTGKEIKAGTCRGTVSYLGPYHYGAYLDRQKAQSRGL